MFKKILFIVLCSISLSALSAVSYNFTDGQMFKTYEDGEYIIIKERLNKGDIYEPMTCYLSTNDPNWLAFFSYNLKENGHDFGTFSRPMKVGRTDHLCVNHFTGISADKDTNIVLEFMKGGHPSSKGTLLYVRCWSNVADPDNFDCV